MLIIMINYGYEIMIFFPFSNFLLQSCVCMQEIGPMLIDLNYCHFIQYISLPADAVRPDSRLYRQVYDGTDFPELKMCGYNGKKWLLRQWFWLFYNSF